jgi:phosphoribosyl-dephospho-CoA transferase
MAMPPLRRHQLAYLSAPGWRAVLARDWDAQAREVLRHWAAQGLPLVVTRQHLPRLTREAPVALGLAAPASWGRRAIALQVAPGEIAWLSEFPALGEPFGALPRGLRASLQRLGDGLRRQGLRGRVYGSAGWQQLTGLSYLHERSDLDLWLRVEGAAQADRAAACLQQTQIGPRLDGELMFPDGSAVAWREWADWREGRCRQLLVKQIDRALLTSEMPGECVAWPAAA